MRMPIPPAWRALAAGDTWTLAAVAAGLLGAAWVLSPASVLEHGRDLRARLAPTRPANRTGELLGYRSVFQDTGTIIDPIDVLTTRAALRTSITPVYRGGRVAEYVRAPAPYPLPLGAQSFAAGLRTAPLLPSPPAPGVAITAAEVLAAQRPRASS